MKRFRSKTGLTLVGIYGVLVAWAFWADRGACRPSVVPMPCHLLLTMLALPSSLISEFVAIFVPMGRAWQLGLSIFFNSLLLYGVGAVIGWCFSKISGLLPRP